MLIKGIGFFLLILIIWSFKASPMTRGLVSVGVICGLLFIVTRRKR